MFCTLYLLKVLCKLKLVIRLILLRFMRLFADDACLSYQHSDPEYLNEVINKELGKVYRWLRADKQVVDLECFCMYVWFVFEFDTCCMEIRL